MSPEDLQAFETGVADLFNAGKIRHPVHLSDGNEAGVIAAFKDIEPGDWLAGSWRFHYQCLMHGVSQEDLLAAIYRGESMALCFPERRIVCSAIVGGILPIALGIAMGIKRDGGEETVHCWLGDMTAKTGIAHECMTYGANHDLPIRWVIEDNGISVCTPTGEVWKEGGVPWVSQYSYRSKYPHAGAGQRVQF